MADQKDHPDLGDFAALEPSRRNFLRLLSAAGFSAPVLVVLDRSSAQAHAPAPDPTPTPTPTPTPQVPQTSRIKGKSRLTTGRGSYTFSSPTPGATFECRLDGGAWKACSSPLVVKTKKLDTGAHQLRVRAVLAGVPDPTPSVKTFTVIR